MKPEHKAEIAKFIGLYGLSEEQKTAAEGFILPAAMYLRRHDLPRALYPVCAQLAIAQMVASGLLAEVSSSSSESGEESTKKNVEEAIKKADTATKEKKKLILPEMLDTNELRYYQAFNERGPVITVMGMMIGILLYALQKQNIRKAEEERKKQMIEDYPEVISKLTLYLGAGMTVKKAWRKITEGYMKEKEDKNERYVYEEMRQTCHEMDSGVTEAEGYENFGRRCDLQIYIRLGALLSQNLRKGTKGLSELLKLESIQAFEERKARAKRLGEEAGTKLLLPMFLMLVVVLIIVIVPAFLTMQI